MSDCDRNSCHPISDNNNKGENILVNLDANKATDVDGIPAIILKLCARELSMPLSRGGAFDCL